MRRREYYPGYDGQIDKKAESTVADKIGQDQFNSVGVCLGKTFYGTCCNRRRAEAPASDQRPSILGTRVTIVELTSRRSRDVETEEMLGSCHEVIPPAIDQASSKKCAV